MKYLSLIKAKNYQLILFAVGCLCDRISVENAYINEKEDACSALGELALTTGYGLHMDIIERL